MEHDFATLERHVTRLFDGFLAHDVATLRDGRTADWKGFYDRAHLTNTMKRFGVTPGRLRSGS